MALGVSGPSTCPLHCLRVAGGLEPAANCLDCPLLVSGWFHGDQRRSGFQGEYLGVDLYKEDFVCVWLLWFCERKPAPRPGLCAVCEEMDAGRTHQGPVGRKHVRVNRFCCDRKVPSPASKRGGECAPQEAGTPLGVCAGLCSQAQWAGNRLADR